MILIGAWISTVVNQSMTSQFQVAAADYNTAITVCPRPGTNRSRISPQSLRMTKVDGRSKAQDCLRGNQIFKAITMDKEQDE